MALKNHPAIAEQRGKIIYQEGKLGEARGAYYPKVYAGMDYSRVKPVGRVPSSTITVGGLPSGGSIPAVSTSSKAYEQYAESASISQRLFDFGQTRAQVAAQRLLAASTFYDLDNIRQQVTLYVKQTYYKLLGAKRAVAVREEALQQYMKHMEYAKALNSVGLKPKVDVLKAETDLSNARVDLIKTENEVRLQTVTLSNAMGLPDNLNYSVTEESHADWVELPIDDAMRIAFERRPDLLSAKQQRESAMEAVKAARRADSPVLSGNASYYYAGTLHPLESGWQAGLNISIPVFTGFVISSQITEAQGNYTSAVAREKNVRQNIILDLQQGYLSMREAADRIRSGEVAVRHARESMAAATEQYRLGMARAVDVADAVAALAKAQLDEISARFDHQVAQAMIDKAMGGR